jgi:hypothetical protein
MPERKYDAIVKVITGNSIELELPSEYKVEVGETLIKLLGPDIRFESIKKGFIIEFTDMYDLEDVCKDIIDVLNQHELTKVHYTLTVMDPQSNGDIGFKTIKGDSWEEFCENCDKE